MFDLGMDTDTQFSGEEDPPIPESPRLCKSQIEAKLRHANWIGRPFLKRDEPHPGSSICISHPLAYDAL